MDNRDFDIRPIEDKARDFHSECLFDDDGVKCDCGAELEIMPWNDGMLDVVIRTKVKSWRERIELAWYVLRRGKTIDVVTLPPKQNARLFAWLRGTQPTDNRATTTTTATHMVVNGDLTWRAGGGVRGA